MSKIFASGMPPDVIIAVERVAFDQLHRDETVAVRFFDAEDRDDVGVVEGGYCDRLSFESFKSFRT